MVTCRSARILVVLSALALPRLVWAGPSAPDSAGIERPHGPAAPFDQLPSHTFRLAPRWPQLPQLSVHAGLLQPILFQGFNAAIDLRWGPLVMTYSHGEGLNYSAQPQLGLTPEEADAGLLLESPWTTGFGVGVTVLDELYVLIDLKAHRYDARLGNDEATYRTISVGGEVGWRFFLWRGFFVQPVLRFWPNIHSTLEGDQVTLGTLRHRAKNLGFFANVTVGFAFNL